MASSRANFTFTSLLSLVFGINCFSRLSLIIFSLRIQSFPLSVDNLIDSCG